jgi:hypothetical protein
MKFVDLSISQGYYCSAVTKNIKARELFKFI